MLHKEYEFETHDGLKLYGQCWLPDGQIKANLVVVHGIGEHSSRYADFAAWFVPAGYAVHAFDHRGHGRSPGVRGYIKNWAEFREDVRVYLTYVLEHYPDFPTFLLGHSMGGLVVLDYGLHYGERLQGLVASGPILMQGPGSSAFLLFLAKLIKPFLPKLQLNNSLDAQGLSRDPAVIQSYQVDPLVHSFATPSLGVALNNTMLDTMAHADEWRADLPLLIVHGGADPICAPEGSARFFANVSAKDKTRHEYPEYRHEVFNEIDREKVLGDVRDWLDAHLP